MSLIQGDVPVFSEAAMGGDTEHLGVYVLHGELFCGDCIHFILQNKNKYISHSMMLSRH